MKYLIGVCLILFLLILPNPINAINTQMNVDDLLSPEAPSITEHEQLDEGKEYTNKIYGEENIDDLLGPKDVFPFLPDNHRDSGTGKFNTY